MHSDYGSALLFAAGVILASALVFAGLIGLAFWAWRGRHRRP